MNILKAQYKLPAICCWSTPSDGSGQWNSWSRLPIQWKSEYRMCLHPPAIPECMFCRACGSVRPSAGAPKQLKPGIQRLLWPWMNTPVPSQPSRKNPPLCSTWSKPGTQHRPESAAAITEGPSQPRENTRFPAKPWATALLPTTKGKH